MKQGWENKKLGEVCEYFNGKAHEQYIDEAGKFFVINSKFISSDGTLYKKTNKALFPLNQGDIAMVLSDVPNGKALAKCYFVEKDNTYTLNQRICAIRSNRFLNKFLYYQLNRNIHFLQFDNGENQTNLRLNQILDCPLLIPPEAEQHRIIAILDEVFAGIAKAKENAEKNLKNAREIFESYLNSVFVKKGDKWEEKNIGEICDLMTGGTPSTKKPEYYTGGEIRWLVSGDVNMGEIHDCEGKITELGLLNSNAKILPLNSVIIALNGQGKTRGTVAMLRTIATCNQSLVSIYPQKNKTILPEYIYYKGTSKNRF